MSSAHEKRVSMKLKKESSQCDSERTLACAWCAFSPLVFACAREFFFLVSMRTAVILCFVR